VSGEMVFQRQIKVNAFAILITYNRLTEVMGTR